MIKKEFRHINFFRFDLKRTETDEYYWVFDNDFDGILRVSDYYDSRDEAMLVLNECNKKRVENEYI